MIKNYDQLVEMHRWLRSKIQLLFTMNSYKGLKEKGDPMPTT